MANLTTKYLSLSLNNPLVAAASPLTGTLEGVKNLAGAGIGAIVMKSIFEEQIRDNVSEMYDALTYDVHPEALDYLRADLPMQLGPESYLDLLREVRRAVEVPVIASINCSHPDTWLSFARKVEAAGADALELNIYDIPDHAGISAHEIEERHVELVSRVASVTRLPVAVKLSPFYTALPGFACRIEQAGAKSLVLFNRFFQPDIDVSTLETSNVINLSGPGDIRLPLRWTALLRDHLSCDLALTGGVHDGAGLIKALLAGADAVQIYSALAAGGPAGRVIGGMLKRLADWMREHSFAALDDFRGLLKQSKLEDHGGFERFQYVKALAELGPNHQEQARPVDAE